MQQVQANRSNRPLRRLLRRLQKRRDGKVRRGRDQVAIKPGPSRDQEIAPVKKRLDRQSSWNNTSSHFFVEKSISSRHVDHDHSASTSFDRSGKEADDSVSVASWATAPGPRAWHMTKNLFSSFRVKDKKGSTDIGFPESYDEYVDMMDDESFCSSWRSAKDAPLDCQSEDDYQAELEREAALRWEIEQSHREDETDDECEREIVQATDPKFASSLSLLDVGDRGRSFPILNQLTSQSSVSSFGSCESADVNAVFYPNRSGALERLEDRMCAESVARIRSVHPDIGRKCSSNRLLNHNQKSEAQDKFVDQKKQISFRTLTKLNTDRNKSSVPIALPAARKPPTRSNSAIEERRRKKEAQTHQFLGHSSLSQSSHGRSCSLQDFLDEYDKIVDNDEEMDDYISTAS